jgi:hypothetical protein
MSSNLKKASAKVARRLIPAKQWSRHHPWPPDRYLFSNAQSYGLYRIAFRHCIPSELSVGNSHTT